MASTNSNPPIDDELLSAYLDGELTDPQRAEVERRLQGDASAQRLLDELRTVSGTVQGLPVEQPDADLRARILEEVAHREATLRPHARGESPAGGRHDAYGRRGWFWAATAIAAAVLLSLYLPRQGDRANRPLAGVDRERSVSDAGATPMNEALADDEGEPDRTRARDGDAMLLESGLAGEAAPADDAHRATPSATASSDASSEALRELAAMEDRTADDIAAPATGPAGGQGGFADRLGFARPSNRSPQPLAIVPTVEITLASGDAPRAKFQQILRGNNVELQPDNQSYWGYADSRVDTSGAPAPAAPAKQTLSQEPALTKDAVLVEAHPHQVEQILDAFHQDAKNYVRLNVAPSDDQQVAAQIRQSAELHRQQQWQRYSRTAPSDLAQNGEFRAGATEKNEADRAEAAFQENALAAPRGWAIQIDPHTAEQLQYGASGPGGNRRRLAESESQAEGFAAAVEQAEPLGRGLQQERPTEEPALAKGRRRQPTQTAAGDDRPERVRILFLLRDQPVAGDEP